MLDRTLGCGVFQLQSTVARRFGGVGPLITLLLLYGGGYRRILGGRGGHGVSLEVEISDVACKVWFYRL